MSWLVDRWKLCSVVQRKQTTFAPMQRSIIFRIFFLLLPLFFLLLLPHIFCFFGTFDSYSKARMISQVGRFATRRLSKPLTLAHLSTKVQAL